MQDGETQGQETQGRRQRAALPGRLWRWHRAAVDAFAVAGGALLCLVTVLLCLDVFVRYARIASITWIGEVSQYALYGVTFLAAPWALETGRHVAIDVLPRSLGPAGTRVLTRIAALVGTAVCAILLVYACRVLGASIEAGTKVFRTLVFPQWYLFTLPPPVFALLLGTFVKLLATGRTGGRVEPQLAS